MSLPPTSTTSANAARISDVRQARAARNIHFFHTSCMTVSLVRPPHGASAAPNAWTRGETPPSRSPTDTACSSPRWRIVPSGSSVAAIWH